MLRCGKLAVFAVRALLSLIGLSLLWPWAAPYYNRLLTIAVTLVTPQYSLLVDKGDLYICNPAGVPAIGVHGSALHFGLLLLMALFISTPGLKPLLRLKFAGIGLVITFVLHLITLVLLARMGPPSATLALPQILLSDVGFNLLPPIVWAGMCLRKWLITGVKNEASVCTLSGYKSSWSLALFGG